MHKQCYQCKRQKSISFLLSDYAEHRPNCAIHEFIYDRDLNIIGRHKCTCGLDVILAIVKKDSEDYDKNEV